MTKEEAVQTAKQFRKDADDILQRMKAHKHELVKSITSILPCRCDDMGEVIAQHVLSMRDLESCIMRQGMALKYVGQPNPYPHSKDPSSLVVEPTADGLRL